ncbi:hypothetical protein J0L31_11430 [Terrisporobacter glycolicus]|nr:hypothetical protein [Terrisporobacter glycolicus]
MYNLFSRSEIYQLKQVINKQQKYCTDNSKLDKDSKIEMLESLNNLNKALWKIEKDINSKIIKTLM